MTSVPALGPLWNGGRSPLAHDLTHRTSGIRDAFGRSMEHLWPAFDDCFDEGEPILAPENLIVIPNPYTGSPFSSSNPGEAFYTRSVSKIRCWFGHLDRRHPPGTEFRKGQTIGKVARNLIGGGPHVHAAWNIEEMIAKGVALKHHTNYTHGAPLIGAQLAGLLEPPGTSTKDMWDWIKWYRGREEYEDYGPRNPAVRPNVPKRIPAAWWARLAQNIGRI